LAEEKKRTIMDDSYASLMVAKWQPLVEDIRDNYKRKVLAILLENTMQSVKKLQESTQTTDTGSFIKFLFPIVRRVWAKLIANEICSVQPMTAPVGAVFYFKPVYGSTKGEVTSGDEMVKTFNRYYSGTTIYKENVHTGDGGPIEAGDSVALAYLPIVPGTVKITYNCSGATPQEQTAEDTDSDGKLYFSEVQVGTINYTTGALTITDDVVSATIVYGVYQYNMELNQQIPQVNLAITYDAITVDTKKLKAIWSAEAAEDLKALHGIDAEDELISAIASQIALEVDRELINDMFEAVTQTPGAAYRYAEWDRKRPQYVSEADHLKSLVTVISLVSNRIHRDTRRSPANWIVTSPDMVSLLDTLPNFVPTEDTLSTSNFGVIKAGVLNKRWTVYKDPYFTRDKLLLGLKGASFLDSGYVYAPYVPLQVTPTFYDPADFSLKKGLRTRYSKKLVYEEFFGMVKVSNFDSIYLS